MLNYLNSFLEAKFLYLMFTVMKVIKTVHQKEQLRHYRNVGLKNKVKNYLILLIRLISLPTTRINTV